MRFKNGGWPFPHPPNAPFIINRQSQQAKGIVAWWPTLGQPSNDMFDRGYTPGLFNLPFAGSVVGTNIVGRAWDPSTLITLPTGLGPNSATDETFCLSFWAKLPTSALTDSTAYGILAVQNNSNNYFTFIKSAANTIVWAFKRLGHLRTVTIADITGYDEWHHFVGVVSPLHNLVALYSNGQLIGTDIAGGAFRTAYDYQRRLFDGMDTAKGTVLGSTWPGQVADIRWYLNHLVTADEARALWQADTRWELYQPKSTSDPYLEVTYTIPSTRLPRHPAAIYQIPAIF